MTDETTVLFVCLHGAAKSVLAAADFDRLARARGLAARADFAGTEPDAAIASRVAAALAAEGVDLEGRRPRLIAPADVARAARVVTFACDLGPLAAAARRVERWDDVPAVSDDFVKARATIGAHLARLVDDLAG
jgi:arsenate reductase